MTALQVYGESLSGLPLASSLMHHLRSRHMSPQYWLLKNCRLLERLNQDDLELLERHCRMRKFAKGAAVYLPEDDADAVLLLTRGRIKICHNTADGRQSILAFVEPGELFGELCLFGADERSDAALAMEASDVVAMSRDVMQAVLDANPHIALGVTKLVGLRRLRVERRLMHLLYHSHRERLVHLLLELAQDHGAATLEGIEICLKLSHQDIASLIGSTRESVSVALGELQSEGAVRLKRQRIFLTDPNAIAAAAGVSLSLHLRPLA